MEDIVTCNIVGLDELNQRLQDAAPKVANKILRNSGRKGGEVIRSAIAVNAPRDTGFLDEHIVMTTKTGNGFVKVTIGPQGDAGYFVGATRHGKTIEFKGSPHYAAVAALMAEFGSKHQPAKPFMGPAFDSSSDEALAVFIDETWNALQDLEER